MKTALLSLVLLACGETERPGSSVEVLFPDAPLAITAYRDGDGAFVSVAQAGGSVSFSSTSGRYTVVVGCPMKKTVDVYEGTVEELATITYDRACRAPGTVMLSGQFLHNGQNGQVVKWGLDVGYFANVTVDSYTTMLTEGTHDLVATRNAYLADRVLIERGYTSNTTASVSFDFEGAGAITLSPSMIAANGIGRLGTIANTLVTSGGTVINLSTAAEIAMVMPEAELGAGDFQLLEASGQSGVGSNVPVFTLQHVARSVPTTVTLPPLVQAQPTVTPFVSNGALIVGATWPAQDDAVSYRMYLGGYTVHVSAAEHAINESIAVPDLVGVAGWDTTLNLPAPQGPERLGWTIVAARGASLDDAWRIIPTHEYELGLTGWAGETQL